MGCVPTELAVDLENIPDEIKNRARDLAIVINDALSEQDGVTNFYAMYAALLVAGANLAMICQSDDDPRFAYMLAWAGGIIRDYSQRMHMLTKGLH